MSGCATSARPSGELTFVPQLLLALRLRAYTATAESRSRPGPAAASLPSSAPHLQGALGRPRQWVTEALGGTTQSRPASAAECRLDPGHGPRLPAHFLHLLCVPGILIKSEGEKEHCYKNTLNCEGGVTVKWGQNRITKQHHHMSPLTGMGSRHLRSLETTRRPRL